MSKILESFVNLIAKLDFVPSNVSECNRLKPLYKPALASNNEQKKTDIGNQIRQSLDPIYALQRSNIIDKDFSFIIESGLVIKGHDIGSLYKQIFTVNDDMGLTAVTNELLYLFYLVAPEEDQKIIDAKYCKAKQQSMTPEMLAKSTPPNMMKDLETILERNAPALKAAENDPSKIPSVITSLFSNNAREMGGLVGQALNGFGIGNTSSS